MAILWNGDITLAPGTILSDVTLATTRDGDSVRLEASLRFLSMVETARIPLHMILDTALQVYTNNEASLAWFTTMLLGDHSDGDGIAEKPWWGSARTDSPLGALVAVERYLTEDSNSSKPKLTEFLFYASRHHISYVEIPPTPPASSPCESGAVDEIKVYALPLSSELLQRVNEEPTPPGSPDLEAGVVEAKFLDSAWDREIHQPPIRKRRSAAEAFDQAEERKRKARRKGGQGVAAAAALHSRPENAMPSLHRRSVSSTQVPLQNRPLSRSSSIASVRPTSVREPSVPAVTRPSALSQSQSAPTIPQLPGHAVTEQRNKEFVSKMIMAAMRMKGLKQSKARRSRANSTVASPAIDVTFDDREAERKNDEDFKLVYHQVYKSTCFMFRRHLAIVDLHSHISAVDEAVNQLLGMFLQDPLSQPEDDGVEDDYTPGGRKLFGSSAPKAGRDQNPFLRAAVVERDSKASTPCSRKKDALDPGAA